MQRTFQHWLATKWLEIDQDNLRMKFSAFNVDFSSSSPDPLDLSRPAQAGVKDNYPPKKWLFYRSAFAPLVSFAQITCSNCCTNVKQKLSHSAGEN